MKVNKNKETLNGFLETREQKSTRHQIEKDNKVNNPFLSTRNQDKPNLRLNWYYYLILLLITILVLFILFLSQDNLID